MVSNTQSGSMLEQWAKFNTIKWGCKTKIMRFQSPGSEAFVESLFFINKRGKLYLPPLNPFQPTIFHPSNTDKAYRLTRQWHDAANLMIQEIKHFGGAASLSLPPEITDIRPFLWNGFKTNVKYTYHLKLPYCINTASTEIRNRIKKANAQGYNSSLCNDMAEVYSCLLGTESRKGFSHHLSADDLRLAQQLFGSDCFRCYISYSKEGEPISTNVMIVDNKRALWWIAGSKSEHLSNGVAQQSLFLAFQDLASAGVESIDLVGANIPSVAKYKANWGGDLIPYYQVRIPILKEILRTGLDWIKFGRS
ncbi:hypothetical protein D3C76_64050 [compost metagenome]